MLTEKDKQFLQYWDAVKESRSTFMSKLLGGLPMALLFSLPIILLVVVVNLYFPEWATKISNTSSGTFTTIIIAVIICTLFFSYFRMHYKWEMNDQLYKELKSREQKSNPAKEA